MLSKEIKFHNPQGLTDTTLAAMSETMAKMMLLQSREEQRSGYEFYGTKRITDKLLTGELYVAVYKKFTTWEKIDKAIIRATHAIAYKIAKWRHPMKTGAPPLAQR